MPKYDYNKKRAEARGRRLPVPERASKTIKMSA